MSLSSVITSVYVYVCVCDGIGGFFIGCKYIKKNMSLSKSTMKFRGKCFNCNVNPSKCGCTRNAGKGLARCANRAVCCSTKTDFQKLREQCIENIKQYRIELKQLSIQYRKRDTSKPGNLVLTKCDYLAQKKALEDAIEDCFNDMAEAKKNRLAPLLVRSNEERVILDCAPPGGCQTRTNGASC